MTMSTPFRPLAGEGEVVYVDSRGSGNHKVSHGRLSLFRTSSPWIPALAGTTKAL